MATIAQLVTKPASRAVAYDEEALTKGLVSGDLDRTFNAISDALRAHVDIDRIVTMMVLLAADRMARTPASVNPGWGNLRQELILASSVRTALRYGGLTIWARHLSPAA